MLTVYRWTRIHSPHPPPWHCLSGAHAYTALDGRQFQQTDHEAGAETKPEPGAGAGAGAPIDDEVVTPAAAAAAAVAAVKEARARGLGGAMLGGLAGAGALKSVGVADVGPSQ